MSYTESTNVISITNALPKSDVVGKTQEEYFDFSVTSNITTENEQVVSYEIDIEPLSVDDGYTALTDSQIKVYLENTSTNTEVLDSTLISNLETSTLNTNYKVLYTNSHIHNNEAESITTSYRLRAWIDYNVDSSSWNETTKNQYKFRININKIEGESASIEVLNAPELASNMVPVYYDGTTWRKASATNTDNSWYNYDNKMWANAVTVTEVDGSRTDLLNADVGTEIPMDRINTMWVWIPRFSATDNNVSCSTLDSPTYENYPSCYKVLSDEDDAKIVASIQQAWGFDATTATAFANYLYLGGTLDGAEMDLDYFLTAYTGSTSETITPIYEFQTENIAPYNGGTANSPGEFNITFVSNTSSAHDAFTFGDQELNGFWYAKFETAGTLLTNTQACSDETCDISSITIKPNETSLRNQTVSSLFYTARSMEQSGNPYGWSTSTDTTLNVHMSKNREWAAVAYLTQSKYGRCTNGTCSEITMNNCSSYITGIGADSVTDSSSSTTCTTASNMYNGTSGVLASTTGNITGIYDMSGGASEYVMGVYSDGTNYYSGYSTDYNSGFNGYLYNDGSSIEKTDGIEFFSVSSNDKYYDVYTTEEAYKEQGLQHAVSETPVWYGDGAIFVSPDSPWFNRSGDYDFGTVAGAFAAGSDYGHAYTNVGARVAVIVK